jgi:UDP-N-acetylglucosamine--N-acetylmuramyl-(pentapeptide) pyrophosphoryl-undecaprenol N-acetylglucosamine transferase
MQPSTGQPFIAIACGGTGGHLFPGLAVASELTARGCDVQLMVSRKEVDQAAVKGARGVSVATLPAVGLRGANVIQFGLAFWKSLRQSRREFARRRPLAVLGMGGFTSAPPVLAAHGVGAATFLHESNTIPGRANRWLAPRVDCAFVTFPQSAARLRQSCVMVTGMPVRPEIQPLDAAACRRQLGLDPGQPVLLVTGGSQGARGLNDLVLAALPHFRTVAPHLQFLHLTGEADFEKVRHGYAQARARAVVKPFFTGMEAALGAASAVVSRSGASSLAELAALRLPAVLVPYPHAVDDHQRHNARAFVDSGAARLLEQDRTRPEELVWLALELIGNAVTRSSIADALAGWHKPDAAATVAELVLKAAEDKAQGQASSFLVDKTAPPTAAAAAVKR